MNIVKRIPLPLAGVMLGMAALGNLLQVPLTAALQPAGNTFRFICGLLASIMLILILWKLIFDWKGAREDLKTPIVLGVFATFPMALMLLSVYWKPVIKSAAQVLWFVAIALHICLMILFIFRFVVKFDLKKVFTTWFIMFVGIAVAAITAPAYEKQGSVGTAAFWFGLVCLIILLVVVTARYIKHPQVPDPAKPLICIYAAPTSLCVAGYVQSVTPKSFGFLMTLFFISFVLYLFALVQAARNLRRPFAPSFAAFTFPFVISAIAAKQTFACAVNLEHPQPWLRPIVIIETIIAVCFVAYVFIRFMIHIFGAKQT